MRDFTAKADQGKIDWSLLPWRPIEAAANIMTQAIRPKEEGGKGYGLASWRTVPGGYYRYWAAMIRHITQRFVYNEVIDPESGQPHMAHLICNAAFICQMDYDADSAQLTDDESARFYSRDI
jgi:hypothetical protein